MRKSVFLALLIFIYYIAGMYENPALMVLFLTQLFLIPVMFILSRYLKKHLSVSVEEKTVFCRKGPSFHLDAEGRKPGQASGYQICAAVSDFPEKEEWKKRQGTTGSAGSYAPYIRSGLV